MKPRWKSSSARMTRNERLWNLDLNREAVAASSCGRQPAESVQNESETAKRWPQLFKFVTRSHKEIASRTTVAASRLQCFVEYGNRRLTPPATCDRRYAAEYSRPRNVFRGILRKPAILQIFSGLQ